MKVYAIKSGHDLLLSNQELYYFYDKWAYNKTKKGSDYEVFCRYLDKALPHYKEVSKDIHYYSLSKTIYDSIKEEDIEKAKEWARRYREKTRQKALSRSRSKL